MATILVMGVAGSGAWAAELDKAASPAPEPSQAASALPLSESYFLQQADEAAKSGDAQAAVELYQSAIIYAPSDPVPYERLAEFYVRTGQKELAQRYFDLALAVQPSYAPALQGLAGLKVAAGNPAPGSQASQP